METLVTGASGFVGQHLISALRARGHSVRALVLPGEDSSRLEQRGAAIYHGDVCRQETLAEPMRGVDVVFHLAAIHGLWRPRQEYHAVNVAGTENVCRAVLATGVGRLVHVSTWTVYGMGLRQTVDESYPLKPIDDVYSITKAEADRLVQRYVAQDRLPAVIVRPGTMFGPGDQVNFGRMADRLHAGKAILIGSGRNVLPFVYVTDTVQGMILAGEQERAVGEVYNLACDKPLTQAEMWQAIGRATGANPPRRRVPYYALYAIAAVAERAVAADNPQRQPLVTRLGVKLLGADNRHSIAKAQRELGYAPQVPVAEGVRRAGKWYLEQRSAPVAAPGRPPVAEGMSG